MDESVIKLKNVCKKYNLYQSPKMRLKEVLDIKGRSYHNTFYALNDISLEIKKGTALGIIGTNGSGKSTLLKIICDVLTPTSGEVEVNGKIAALLELGAGFHPEYTGRENIYLNGTMMGYSREEVSKKVDSIISFAEIGEYIDQPVKTYSSGMFARLAFAVSINVDPDILIVDEALSVGDIRFQQKCFRKMHEMKENKTVIMVSHDLGAVSKFCDQVIWVERGNLKMIGKPVDVIKEYQSFLSNTSVVEPKKESGNKKEIERSDFLLETIPDNLQCYGSMEAKIVEMGLFEKGDRNAIHLLKGGEDVTLVMRVTKNRQIENAIVGFVVTDRLGTNIFGLNSFAIGADISSDSLESVYICDFKMPCLNEGVYTISPAFAEGTQSEHTMIHWIYDAYEFQITVPFMKTLDGVLAITDYSYRVE